MTLKSDSLLGLTAITALFLTAALPKPAAAQVRIVPTFGSSETRGPSADASYSDSFVALTADKSLVSESLMGGNLVSGDGDFAFSPNRTPNPPPVVPEASTTVSLGLLLILGMGGMIAAAKQRKSAS